MVTIMSITMMVVVVVGVVMPVHLIILCIRLVKYSYMYISRDRYYDLITCSPILTIPTTKENSEKVLRRDIGLKPSTVLV